MTCTCAGRRGGVGIHAPMICPQTDHVFKTRPTEKFLSNKRSTRINSPQLKLKNQIIAYRWTFEKGSQKLDKIL